ncbi:NAD(P)H-binding protein [Methylomarinum vadi]|uniref:NAD(P)H-binding protein n=1 Tax=Methylomarinum vadi TaxID=438855 RepID=UPI0004DF476E|nr:NAD(P)H-binding protein [Methylomarinum vadi]
MNILLTGASGFIGRHILAELERGGHRVIACCRHPDRLYFKSENTTALMLDFTDLTEVYAWLPHLTDIDVVINCVGIIGETQTQRFAAVHRQAPIALFRAASQAGVKKVIQLSALCADATAVTPYHLSKKTADDALRKLEIDWYILQPSLVYGHGAHSMPFLQALSALPLLLTIDGGRQSLQPVHIDDVVAAVARCLQPSAPVRQTLALVGPEAINYIDLLKKLRRRLGKTSAPTVSLPENLARPVAWLGKLLGEQVLNPDNIKMLQAGNSASSAPLTQWLGRPPLSLSRQLLRPADQAERWHAGLYFLRPLLRLSIAMVWLWSGLVSLFFYPHELSYDLLAGTGISGIAAPLALYGLALMDIALGLATLMLSRPRRLLLLQFGIVLLYTLTVGISLPEFWLHPFGPIVKNIPLLIALLVSIQLEGEQS